MQWRGGSQGPWGFPDRNGVASWGRPNVGAFWLVAGGIAGQLSNMPRKRPIWWYDIQLVWRSWMKKNDCGTIPSLNSALSSNSTNFQLANSYDLSVCIGCNLPSISFSPLDLLSLYSGSSLHAAREIWKLLSWLNH